MRIDDDLDEPLLVLKDVAIGYDSSDSLVNSQSRGFPRRDSSNRRTVRNRKIYATKNNRWPS